MIHRRSGSRTCVAIPQISSLIHRYICVLTFARLYIWRGVHPFLDSTASPCAVAIPVEVQLVPLTTKQVLLLSQISMVSRVRDRQILVSDVAEIDVLRRLDRLVPKRQEQQDFFESDWRDLVSDPLKESLESLQRELTAAMPASVQSVGMNILAGAFDFHTTGRRTHEQIIRARNNLSARLGKQAVYQVKKDQCLDRLQRLKDKIDLTHSFHIKFAANPLISRCMGFNRGGQKIVVWQWLVKLKIKPSITAGTEQSLSICSAVTLEDSASWSIGKPRNNHSHDFLRKTETATSGLTSRGIDTASEAASLDLTAPTTQSSLPAQRPYSDSLSTPLDPDSAVNLSKNGNIKPSAIQSRQGYGEVATAPNSSPTRFIARAKRQLPHLRQRLASSGRNDEGNLAARRNSPHSQFVGDQRAVSGNGSVISCFMPSKIVHNKDPYYPQSNANLNDLPSEKSYEDFRYGSDWSQYTSAHGKPFMNSFIGMMSTRHSFGNLNVPPTAPSGLY